MGVELHGPFWAWLAVLVVVTPMVWIFVVGLGEGVRQARREINREKAERKREEQRQRVRAEHRARAEQGRHLKAVPNKKEDE